MSNWEIDNVVEHQSVNFLFDVLLVVLLRLAVPRCLRRAPGRGLKDFPSRLLD